MLNYHSVILYKPYKSSNGQKKAERNRPSSFWTTLPVRIAASSDSYPPAWIENSATPHHRQWTIEKSIHVIIPPCKRAIVNSCDGRVVKAMDLKSIGIFPRRFEPCSQRNIFSFTTAAVLYLYHPSRLIRICQEIRFESIKTFISFWISFKSFSISFFHIWKKEIEKHLKEIQKLMKQKKLLNVYV